MKSSPNPFLRSAVLPSLILCFSHPVLAADYYWDVNGATGGTGGAGNWSTINTWRDGSATGALGNWVDGNNAFLGGSAGTLTISSGTTITTPKITVQTSNYALSGGTVSFGGTSSNPAIIDVNGTSGFTFSSGATGNLKVMATGSTVNLASAAPMIISGSTSLSSFELAMNQDQNHLILGNAAALGAGSATVKLTKGTLNLGNTSGVNLSYNNWATDLAGGTVRARFALQTWNGAASLSADSQVMTRNAGDAKLIFSSTGTINLGSSSLTLMASSLSQGIELNGVISGTGNLVTGSNPLGGSDNGNGTTRLNAANTFSGSATTTLNIGTLALGNVDALQNATLNTGLAGSQAVTFTVAGTNSYNIGALTGSDALAIGANSISLGNKAGSSSFGADISGTGGLTKTGSSSTQILTAATNYSGATSITGGTLSLTGSGAINSSSGITVNGSSAKLLHSGSSAISPLVTLTQGTLTGSGTVNNVSVGAGTGGIISNNDGVAGSALNIGNLTFNGGASINLFSNSTSAPLNVTTLTNDSTAGQVTITASNTGGWVNGTTYNLINFTTLGGTGGDNFAHAVNHLSARQSPTWGNTGSAITLAINGDTPRWIGAGDGKWNTASTGNWKLVTAGTDTIFLPTDDVLFDDNATGTTTLEIDAANVAANSTIFDNSSKNYSLTGAFGISTGYLTKNGTGSLSISTPNTYTGATTLNAGAVTLSGAGALGSGSPLNLNGASLDLGGSSQSVGAVSITAAAASGNTLSNGSLTGTSYAVSNSSGNVGITANLLVNSGAGFTKSGAGTVTLSGANTYTGTTAINAGSIALSGAGTLGSGADLTLGGGSLDLGALSTSVGALSITTAAASGDTISNGSLTGTSYAASNSSGDAIISANLLANVSAGFTKSGAGTTTLSGLNTYTGATAVTAGTLKAGSASAFGTSSVLNLSSTGTFDLGGFNSSFTTLSSTSNNTITTSGAGAGTDVLTISSIASDTATSALFTDNGTRRLQVNLTGNESGSWQATSNVSNTYSGGLVLGGTMRASVQSGALGTPGAITSSQFGTGSITLNGSSQIWFAGSNRTILNDIIINGNTGNGSRAGTFRIGTNSAAITGLIISGNINANLADAWFGSDQNATGSSQLLLSGKLTGTSGFRFFQSANAFTWTTTVNNQTGSPNDYSGNTTINSAQTTLALGAANQIPNGVGKGDVILTSGFLDLAGFDETINGLSGAGTVNNVTAGTTNTLTLGDGNATAQNFSGAIQNTIGTLSLTKIGSGTQILSGANTYTGATLISGGTLQIGNGGGTGTLSSSSTITNNSTLAFNRTGTITQGTDFAAGITGTGALSTSGTGTVILSGTNDYTGTTAISNGELRMTSANALSGTSGITVNSGRLSLSGGITAGSGKSVTINGAGANFFGALQGNAGTNVWEGGVVVGTTAGTRIGVNSGQLTVSGAISGSTAANGLMLRPNTGTTLVVSGANTYEGDTTIISGTGVVKLDGGNDRLPTGTKLIFGGSAVSGILDLNGRSQSIAGLSVSSGTTNEIRSTTAATLTVNAASVASTFSGIITGETALTKTGAESLTLAGVNTYTGGTSIQNGSLILTGGNDRLATTGTVSLGDVANTGKLVLGDATTARNQTLAGLTSTGLGGSVVGAHASTNAVLTVNPASGTTTFGGVLGGVGTNENNLALTKAGAGILALTGSANTYSGNTTVTAGTLSLGASGALPTGSTVVLAGGTLLSDGVTNTGASLSLSAASTLDLGGTSAMTFTTVDAASFTSNTLQVWNWSGTLGGGGTERFMVPDGSLDSTQLSNISFFSGAGTGPLGTAGFSLSNPGELVPVPEPGAILTSGLLTLAALTRRRR